MCNRATRTWPAVPAAVASARRYVAEQLRAWGVVDEDPAAGALDDVLLAVSELVTNAVKYGGGDTTVTVETHAHRITVEVTDRNPAPARPRQPTSLDPGGRGLALVTSLGDGWGQRANPDGSKTVWWAVTVPAGAALASGCTYAG